MGTDIYSHVEVRRDGVWRQATGDLFPDNDEYSRRDEPFPGRNYGLFGFLADVRNYSECPPIDDGCRGLPDDVSDEILNKHGPRGTSVWDDPGWLGVSWLTVAELLAYDYDRTFVNQHPYHDEDPHTTVRDFLGEWYFQRLAELAKLGPPKDVRVVFWFG